VFYPVFLDLRGRQVLVVGAGPVAERKVESLLAVGAAITVVAPDLTATLEDLVNSNKIQLRRRRFQESDLEGMFLVISATNVPVVQDQIAATARARNIPINTVDQPALCDFIVPAVLRKGDVVLALSTSGKSPVLAAALRAKLDTVITDNVARAAQVLGEVRSEVHARVSDADRRKKVFEDIVASGILDWIGECDDAAALQRVRGMIDRLI